MTRLSTVARRVENVRHYDLDLYQVCADCKYPQLFAEVKSYDAHDREWEQTRSHARFYGRGCLALLVVERGDEIGVKKYSSHSGIITPLVWGTEGHLLQVLEYARSIHACL